MHFLILQVVVNDRPKYKQKRCLNAQDSVSFFIQKPSCYLISTTYPFFLIFMPL